VYCHYIHDSRRTCDNVARDNGSFTGGTHTPFPLTRFTRATAGGDRGYFRMSTWNPYRSMIMRMVFIYGL